MIALPPGSWQDVENISPFLLDIATGHFINTFHPWTMDTAVVKIQNKQFSLKINWNFLTLYVMGAKDAPK